MDKTIALLANNLSLDPPHIAYFDCARRFIPLLSVAALPIAVGLAALFIFPMWTMVQSFFLVIVGIGCVLFLVVFRLFRLARDMLTMHYGEWQQNQIAARNLAAQRMALEVRVSGRNNTVMVNSPTQNNAIIVPETATNARQFVQHFQEFVERARMLKSINDGNGTERRHWLLPDGAREYYLFRDGSAMSRPEYEMMVETLRTMGALSQRRQGTAGTYLPEQSVG